MDKVLPRLEAYLFCCMDVPTSYSYILSRLEIKRMLDRMGDELDERERRIIELRYALGGGEEVTQREIAQMLNISRSYVSRIEKKALKKMSAAMGE